MDRHIPFIYFCLIILMLVMLFGCTTRRYDAPPTYDYMIVIPEE